MILGVDLGGKDECCPWHLQDGPFVTVSCICRDDKKTRSYCTPAVLLFHFLDVTFAYDVAYGEC